MKTKASHTVRRALAVLTTGLALGGLFASPARASIYQMQSNYVAGTAAPFNGGGGIPAAAYVGTPVVTATNVTLKWYGTRGWYTAQGSPNMLTWTNLGTVMSTDPIGITTVTNPFGLSGYFQLSQANSFSGQGNCSGCHGDKYTPWLGTPHASALSLVASMPPSLGCLACHTVGYGQPTGYTNQTLTPNLANVGCECCHGPAGWHKNSDHSVITPVVSMDPAICGSCHTGSHHPTYTEYTNVNTAGQFPGLSHSHPSQSSSTGCAVCHSANNRMVMLNEYSDMLGGSGHSLSLVTGADATLWSVTCATCHDPHTSNHVGQLRYTTYSTNWYTMPTTFDARQVVTTNLGRLSTNTVNYNTVFDNVYNPNVQICGQCHNTRGNRWDGNAYFVITNTPILGPTTNVAYVDIYCTNSYVQVFTNGLGQPYLTNTYTSVYVCGRGATTNVVMTQTNAPYSVGVISPLIPYTNAGTVFYQTNSSGYGRVPHSALQYNILIGNVDYDYATVAGVANKTHAHSSAPDQCVTCHVPNYSVNANTNVTGHTFNVDFYGCQATCHSTYTSDALTAKIKNLQFIESNNIVRVANMLNQWALTKTTGPLASYAQMAWEYTIPGSLGSTDATHKSGPATAYNYKYGLVPSGTNDNLQLQLPQDIRIARNDLYMAYNDQSMGVHNPTYVQALLDDAAARVAKQFSAANFSAKTLAGFAPLSVTFTNQGSGITAYNWSFGDGGTSASANPTYVYSNPGTYSVVFTATTASGSETLMRTNYIHVETAPAISFVADQTSVSVGTTVNFTSTSTSTNEVALWGWYPRLGVTGASSYNVAGGNPSFSYTYTNAGTFSVELRATCPGGANGSYTRTQVTNVNYIVVH